MLCHFNKIYRGLLVCMVILLLAACGGGGGSGNDDQDRIDTASPEVMTGVVLLANCLASRTVIGF